MRAEVLARLRKGWEGGDWPAASAAFGALAPPGVRAVGVATRTERRKNPRGSCWVFFWLPSGFGSSGVL